MLRAGVSRIFRGTNENRADCLKDFWSKDSNSSQELYWTTQITWLMPFLYVSKFQSKILGVIGWPQWYSSLLVNFLFTYKVCLFDIVIKLHLHGRPVKLAGEGRVAETVCRGQHPELVEKHPAAALYFYNQLGIRN